MNISKFAAAGMVTLLTVFSSCNKDDDATTPTPPVQQAPTGTFVTGKVDGASFSSYIMGVSAGNCVKSVVGDITTILVSGADINSNSMTVTLINVTSTGSLTVNSETDSLLAYTPGTGGVSFTTGNCPGVSGTINVTAIDASHVEGTYSFTGTDSEHCDGEMKTVTEGTFRGEF